MLNSKAFQIYEYTIDAVTPIYDLQKYERAAIVFKFNNSIM